MVIFLNCIFLSESKIKCADELKLKTCYISGEEEGVNTKYVKACKKGKKCVTENGIGNCIKIKEQIKEGKKCKSSIECLSGYCKDEKCAVKGDGEACDMSQNCGDSSYCKFTNDTGVCAPLSAVSESCRDDIDCQVGLVCNYNSNKCIEMFSIKNGENSNGPYYCESGLYNDNAGTCIGLTGNAKCSAVNGN